MRCTRPLPAAPWGAALALLLAAAQAHAGKDSQLVLESADGTSSLRVGSLIQGRFALESVDLGAVAGKTRDTEAAFSMTRVRLNLEGRAVAEGLTYKMVSEYGGGFVRLIEAYADYAVVGGVFHVRAGQWKRPFARHHLTSASRLALNDRGPVVGAFGAEHDIGFALHNAIESSPPVEWSVGVFNGSGTRAALSGRVTTDPATGDGVIAAGAFSNVPAVLAPALVARVGFNHGELLGTDELDLQGGPLRFGVAASVLGELNADGDRRSGVRGTLDLMAKSEGLVVSGAVFFATAQARRWFRSQEYAARGAQLNASYTVAGLLSPTLRIGIIDPDGDDSDEVQVAGGVTAHLREHAARLTVDAAAASSQSGETTDYVARAQFQLTF